MNQCDGCRRHLPIIDGVHMDFGYDMIGCTKDRYTGETTMLSRKHYKAIAEKRPCSLRYQYNYQTKISQWFRSKTQTQSKGDRNNVKPKRLQGDS